MIKALEKYCKDKELRRLYNDKHPYWQIRHNPKNYLELLIYHNAGKLSGIHLIKEEIESKVMKLSNREHVDQTSKDRLQLAAKDVQIYGMDAKMTEYSSVYTEDDIRNTPLDFAICHVVRNAESELQEKSGGRGSTGFFLHGEYTNGAESLFAATSGHVVLDGFLLHKINDAKDHSKCHTEAAYELNKRDNKGRPLKEFNIETNADGDIQIDSPPLFSYKEAFPVDETSPGFEKIVQDMAVLKIKPTSKEKAACLLNAHEDSILPGILGNETLTIVDGVLRIETLEDIKNLEAQRVRIVVLDSLGYLVKGTHTRSMELIKSPPKDTEAKVLKPGSKSLSGRLHFVLEKTR